MTRMLKPQRVQIISCILIFVTICVTFLYWDNNRHDKYQNKKAQQLTALPLNVSNLKTLTAYLKYKFPHLLTGEPKPLKGSVCERYRKQPQEEKFFMKTFWGPTSLEETKDVSFVTQLSYNRLSVLELVARHWQGPISAAIYVNWEEFSNLFDSLQTFSELVSRTNIALHVVFKHEEFYPVNFLRNLALNASMTEYVYLSDVDFIPSIGSYDTLKDKVLQGLCDGHTTLVVPSFEFIEKPHEYPRNKSELLKMWDQNITQPFHWTFWSGIGHWSTNFYKWKETDEVYEAKPAGTYEPYIVMKKTEAPVYREAFLGREFDKISFCYDVAAQGFKFLVLPDVFSIHMPHPTHGKVTYHECSSKLFGNLKAELRKRYPETMKTYKFNIMSEIRAERKKMEAKLAQRKR